MKLRVALLGLVSAVASRAAETPPLFYATLTLGKEHRFMLVDPAGKASDYLRLGDSFAGYMLKAYDPDVSVLEVERDGRVSRIALVPDARVKSAALADRRFLETLVVKIQPTGIIVKSRDDVSLIFGHDKFLPVGSKLSVRYEDKDYEFELVAAGSSTYTLRYRDQDFIRPTGPVRPKQQ